MKKTLLTFIVVIFAVGCQTTSLQNLKTEGVQLEEDETRIWRRSKEEQHILDRSGFLLDDSTFEVYLNQIVNSLQAPELSEHVNFKAKVIKNPSLNAFAYPNGVIYVHTGILARIDNEAQLASLLGHEMTHVTHRHGVKQFRNLKNMSAVLASIQVVALGAGAGPVGDIANVLGQVGTLASVTGYSKDLEREADQEGYQAMIRAGYDPAEAPKLFEHLKTWVEENDIKEPFFFGTHPRLEERIENYRKLLIASEGARRAKRVNAEQYKKMSHRIILLNAGLDLDAGRFALAEKGVEKYLKIMPDDHRAFCLLGNISMERGKEGDIDKALEYYRKALLIDSNYAEAYKGMGMVYFKRGDLSSAQKSFESYLSCNPRAQDKAYIEQYIKHCKE